MRDPLKTSVRPGAVDHLAAQRVSAAWAAVFVARASWWHRSTTWSRVPRGRRGRLRKQLPMPKSNDEIGFLLRSFNAMTRKIARAAARSPSKVADGGPAEKLPRDRSSPHVDRCADVDETGFIKSGNPAACLIFDIDSNFFSELYISMSCAEYPLLAPFFDAVKGISSAGEEWQEEIVMFTQSAGAPDPAVRGTTRWTSQTDDRRNRWSWSTTSPS